MIQLSLSRHMGYELFIFPPPDAAPVLTPQALIAAFAAAGLPCTEQPDDHGHWLVFQGGESTLDLTLQDSMVSSAHFRYVTQDDASVLVNVFAVFHELGWRMGDDKWLT